MNLPDGVETIVYVVRCPIGEFQPNDEIVVRPGPGGRPTYMLCRHLRAADIEPVLESRAIALGPTEPPEKRAEVAVASSSARVPSRRRSRPHLVR